ncbi:hypothetical protein HZH68_004346 [Vespula germanica]|uniref:Uncharacterized protein n=1 Tax=Vespula germanica TaxID=30212 RepID=A0A834NH53_VESGE|nr:hypothetical protein HZH68_004346 [Vespula germanica]
MGSSGDGGDGGRNRGLYHTDIEHRNSFVITRQRPLIVYKIEPCALGNDLEEDNTARRIEAIDRMFLTVHLECSFHSRGNSKRSPLKSVGSLSSGFPLQKGPLV